MRTIVTTTLTMIAAILLPLSVSAQDDMYFTPTKADVKAKKDAYDRTHGNYHVGRDVPVDEYNRRYRTRLKSEYAVVDGDSVIASDVIDFKPRPKDGSDTLVVDTIYNDEEDFQNSYRLSRWDDYYCGYRPWFRPYNYWGVRYYGWYDPWYSPFWDPWYDPWFDPWYGPGYWAWDPWYYGWGWGWGARYDFGYYHPWAGGGVSYRASYRPGYGPRNDGQRRDSHFYANHSRTGSYGGTRGSSRGSSSYSIAQRNGGSSRGSYGGSRYSSRGSQWSHSTFRGSNSGGSSRSSSYSGGSPTYSGYSGGGYSGGGYSGGGSSSGGHSGGGGGHGGGGFGSHR